MIAASYNLDKYSALSN